MDKHAKMNTMELSTISKGEMRKKREVNWIQVESEENSLADGDLIQDESEEHSLVGMKQNTKKKYLRLDEIEIPRTIWGDSNIVSRKTTWIKCLEENAIGIFQNHKKELIDAISDDTEARLSADGYNRDTETVVKYLKGIKVEISNKRLVLLESSDKSGKWPHDSAMHYLGEIEKMLRTCIVVLPNSTELNLESRKMAWMKMMNSQRNKKDNSKWRWMRVVDQLSMMELRGKRYTDIKLMLISRDGLLFNAAESILESIRDNNYGRRA